MTFEELNEVRTLKEKNHKNETQDKGVNIKNCSKNFFLL